MALNLRTAVEMFRLYGPMWQQLALFVLASASQLITTLLFNEAHGENT